MAQQRKRQNQEKKKKLLQQGELIQPRVVSIEIDMNSE